MVSTVSSPHAVKATFELFFPVFTDEASGCLVQEGLRYNCQPRVGGIYDHNHTRGTFAGCR